ncbi:Rieske 2Fe-2S domain-containing protein [Lentzea aerocolonigenes]|uniref:Rieske 2Fe-2S domain-containing protein n=1 Tax=Lentzea aerocolonigenes TaxID=68170 RepID=UPI0009DD7AF6
MAPRVRPAGLSYRLRACDVTCTHQGATVGKSSGGVMACPAHGRQVAAADGAVKKGPPRRHARDPGEARWCGAALTLSSAGVRPHPSVPRSGVARSFCGPAGVCDSSNIVQVSDTGEQ